MPLPIAVGGVSLSSERIEGPYRPPPSGEYLGSTTDSQSKTPEPYVSEPGPYQNVMWAVCPRNEWQARTVVSFYDEDIDMESNNHNNDNDNRSIFQAQQQQQQQYSRKRRRMVEIRVQISPLARALSPKAYRETRHQLELFTHDDECDDNGSAYGSNSILSSENHDNDDDDDDSFSSDSETDDDDHLGNPRQQTETAHRQQPQVVFSHNRRHLMVLLFHKKSGTSNYEQSKERIETRHEQQQQQQQQQQQSAIIVFQLRKPRSTTTNNSSHDHRSNIPLPSYIAKAAADSSNGRSDTSGELTDHPKKNSTGESPAVATHPKFVPSCQGITAICRLSGERTTFRPSGARRQQPAPPNPAVFLVFNNSDGTLNWVDPQSAQITETAKLPARIHSKRWFVSSMNASPASTLDSGMVALAIAWSSNSSISSPSRSHSSQSSRSVASYVTDCDEDDVDSIAGDIETRTSSSSSSGNSDETAGAPKVKGGDCVLFEWSHASSSINKPLQRMISRDDLETCDEKHQALDFIAKKQENVDPFFPKELESKRLCSPQSPPSSSVPLSHEKNLAPVDQPRQHSGTRNEIGSGYALGIMRVGLRSVWSPPSGSDENSEARVTEACFGSLSSVLCVVYTHTNRGEISLGPRQKLAQVLSISDNNANGSNEGCDLISTVSLYLSPDQVEQAPSVANIDHKTNYHSDYDNVNDECDDEKYSECQTSTDEGSSDEESGERRKEDPYGTTIESRLVGIQHDPDSDSFVISSIVCGNRGKKDHWVGCVWNWRANAIGWMVQHEMTDRLCSLRNRIAGIEDALFWSRLYFGRDPCNRGGLYLIYINSTKQYSGTKNYSDSNPTNYNNSTILKTTKRTVSAATLSPANSSDPIVFTERSSLLLAQNHVSFPSVATKDSDATIRELDWKISALPLSYTASQGPPRIAAMGPIQAKSIAVASVRGVCVLDTYLNKWRQFGSPSEERSFSVLSMVWWEGSPREENDHKRDDLLVAITQTRSGAQFLSCWSSKRLDLMHQLMDTPDLEWKPGESQDPEPSWGIPLPKDMKVTSISLLSEPEIEQDKPQNNSNPRRAIVLVYSPDLQNDCLVFRLQVFRNKVSSSHSSEPYMARRSFYVMARKAVQANLNRNIYSGPVTSAFIASASFQFDLRQSKGKKSVEIEEGDFIATLGMACSPGGIHAVCIFKNGETCAASLSNYEVSKYQLSDRILSGVLSSTKRSPIIKCVWTIELLNGNIISWSVPSIVGSQPDTLKSFEVDSSVMEEMHINVSGAKRCKGLDRPFLVCKENVLGKNERFFVGTLCEVGSVSDWAIQSSFGCQFDIALGQVPHSMFGCVLRCGQNRQKFGRGQLGGIDNQLFTSNILEINSYSQSPFTITPPSFVISLYTLLLEASFLQMDLKAAEPSSFVDNLKNLLQTVDRQVQHRLTSVRNTDMSMMALRLVTFRSLEMIAKTHKKHSNEHSEYTEFNLLLSQILLSTVIGAARTCTSDLQFASLFLEVGRQTEPSNLQHLFPLPLRDNQAEMKLIPGTSGARSVVDLFMICIEKGSFAASASALPLLTSKAQARYYCELLLDEAINNFVRNSSSSHCKFDSTEEERRVLGDFFRFGMKLEDAEIYEENLVAESQEGRLSPDDISINTEDQSLSNQMFVPETPEDVKRSLICNLSASSSILNYIVPSSMRGESEKQRMEDAIRREASSFIHKSLDDPALDFAMLPDWDDSFGAADTNKADTNSVAYLVGDALLELLQAEFSNNNWKVIAAFAKMILQEGVEAPSSYSLFVEVVDKAQPLDVLLIIPESYDDDNELEDNMITYIEEEISSCCRQISFADANHIIDMSLLLIDRVRLLPLVDIGDQTVMELGLVFIVMVAGDISGRSQYIQDLMDDDSLLKKCYKRALVQSKKYAQRKADF